MEHSYRSDMYAVPSITDQKSDDRSALDDTDPVSQYSGHDLVTTEELPDLSDSTISVAKQDASSSSLVTCSSDSSKASGRTPSSLNLEGAPDATVSGVDSFPEIDNAGSVNCNKNVYGIEESPSENTPRSCFTTTKKQVLPYGVALPDIRGQPDPDGILARRLRTYQSFTAPDSYMQHLPPIDESLFDNKRRHHLKYYVKTVATIKCDQCEQKCRANSEVYRCRECTAQICRECVEDKLSKEQADVGGVPWEWLSPCHEPFKAAYLLRKEKASGAFGHGEWIGSVQMDGHAGVVQVKLELTPHSKPGSKATKNTSRRFTVDGSADHTGHESGSSPAKTSRKKRALDSSSSTTDYEEEQRKQVQAQSMSSHSRRKVDRIRDLARAAGASSPTAPRHRVTPEATIHPISSETEEFVGRDRQQSPRRGSQDSQATIEDLEFASSTTPESKSQLDRAIFEQVTLPQTPTSFPKPASQPAIPPQIRLHPQTATPPTHSIPPLDLFHAHPHPTQAPTPTTHLHSTDTPHAPALPSHITTHPPTLAPPTRAYFEGQIVIPHAPQRAHDLVAISINAIDTRTNERVQIPIRGPGPAVPGLGGSQGER